jgi:hypothetical protein
LLLRRDLTPKPGVHDGRRGNGDCVRPRPRSDAGEFNSTEGSRRTVVKHKAAGGEALKLVEIVEHAIPASIMGAVLDKVVGPNMVAVLRP